MSIASVKEQNFPTFSPMKWRKAWLEIDKNENAIAYVQSWQGKIALFIAFTFVLALSQQLSTASLGLISLTLLAVIFKPAYRVPIIAGSSLFFLAMRPFRSDGWTETVGIKAAELTQGLSITIPALALQVSGVASFVLFAFFFLYGIKCSKQEGSSFAAPSIVVNRPLVSLITIWATATVAAILLPDGGLLDAYLWTFAGVMMSCLWFLAYAAVDEKRGDNTNTIARASVMRPFWGGSATPIGKGFGYLNKFDAKNDYELAVTRLKALKLVVWAFLLTGLMYAMEYVARDVLALPVLQDTIMAHASGNAFSQSANWSSVIYNYFLDLVIISVWGHFIVAVIRMLGYRIPRNTRNPLAARSLADFWNRYFFYFKELLVDFFFYPAFVRYFKTMPKLRIAFATFCAAGLGNFFYHFARDTFQFANHSFMDALMIFQSAAFYSLLLATGLVLSQLNPYKPKPTDGFFRYEVLPRLNVCAFFCLVKIFDDITGEGSVAERGAFALDLFKF